MNIKKYKEIIISIARDRKIKMHTVFNGVPADPELSGFKKLSDLLLLF